MRSKTISPSRVNNISSSQESSLTSNFTTLCLYRSSSLWMLHLHSSSLLGTSLGFSACVPSYVGESHLVSLFIASMLNEWISSLFILMNSTLVSFALFLPLLFMIPLASESCDDMTSLDGTLSTVKSSSLITYPLSFTVYVWE